MEYSRELLEMAGIDMTTEDVIGLVGQWAEKRPDVGYISDIQIQKVLLAAELERLKGQGSSAEDISKLVELKSAVNNHDNKVALFSALISVHPADFVYPRLLGDELVRKRRISEARIWYLKGIDLDPRDIAGKIGTRSITQGSSALLAPIHRPEKSYHGG